MIYIDTSYITKCYVGEIGSAEVLALLAGRSDLVCSAHGRLEVVASLKRIQREGKLDARALKQAIRRLEADELAGHWQWLPVSSELIDLACRRVAALPPSTFLRAADALHLVAAQEAGCTAVYSHDRHLLAAAPLFDLTAQDVIPAS
jgi:predicted nucleic acid-binding protein